MTELGAVQHQPGKSKSSKEAHKAPVRVRLSQSSLVGVVVAAAFLRRPLQPFVDVAVLPPAPHVITCRVLGRANYLDARCVISR